MILSNVRLVLIKKKKTTSDLKTGLRVWLQVFWDKKNQITFFLFFRHILFDLTFSFI